MVYKSHDYVAGRIIKSACGTKSAALMPSFSYVEIGLNGRWRDVQREMYQRIRRACHVDGRLKYILAPMEVVLRLLWTR